MAAVFGPCVMSDYYVCYEVDMSELC